MKESLEKLLISLTFLFVGCGIVLFELLSESTIFLLYLFFIPIPFVAVGVFLLAVGILGIVGLAFRLK